MGRCLAKLTPTAWGLATAIVSAGCEGAGTATGTTPVVTIALAAIPAIGGVAAAWVASAPSRRAKRQSRRT